MASDVTTDRWQGFGSSYVMSWAPPRASILCCCTARHRHARHVRGHRGGIVVGLVSFLRRRRVCSPVHHAGGRAHAHGNTDHAGRSSHRRSRYTVHIRRIYTWYRLTSTSGLTLAVGWESTSPAGAARIFWCNWRAQSLPRPPRTAQPRCNQCGAIVPWS